MDLFNKWVRVPFNDKNLTSQKDRISVLGSILYDVYLQYSESTLNNSDGRFFGSAECPTLNCIRCIFPPAPEAGWPGASGTAVAVVNGIWLRYCCIYKAIA